MKRVLLLLLIIVLILDQVIIGFELSSNFRFFTKPLLIPILISYYAFSVKEKNWLFISGLVLSFFGDLFLMFSGGFIAGLASFLIAHILYILTFKKLFKRQNLLYLPAILLFIIGLCSFLYPHLGAMKTPVFLYAITIGIMLYVALGTNKKWLIIGAGIFVLSDSILAINIFYQKSLWGSLAVMMTYVLAQYFLVKGMIKKEIE